MCGCYFTSPHSRCGCSCHFPRPVFGFDPYRDEDDAAETAETPGAPE